MSVEEDRQKTVSTLRRTANDSLAGMSFQKRLAEVCEIKDASWRDTLRRVADLVERKTCRYVRTDHCTMRCNVCGREVERFHPEHRFCVKCGSYIEPEPWTRSFRPADFESADTEEGR